MSKPKVIDVTDKSYWCSFWNVAAMQKKHGGKKLVEIAE